mgnify:CR=1 FL=1
MGTYTIENPMYEINPDKEPTIILSFMELSDKHSYLIKIHITSGAIKQIKNIIENVPM